MLLMLLMLRLLLHSSAPLFDVGQGVTVSRMQVADEISAPEVEVVVKEAQLFRGGALGGGGAVGPV